jgi:hypothetical protein
MLTLAVIFSTLGVIALYFSQMETLWALVGTAASLLIVGLVLRYDLADHLNKTKGRVPGLKDISW